MLALWGFVVFMRYEGVAEDRLDTHGVNAPNAQIMPQDDRVTRAFKGEHGTWYNTLEGRIARSASYVEGKTDNETRIEEKYRRWRMVQRLSSRKSVRLCGRVPVNRECGAIVDGNGLHEVMTCGSPWECPHCTVSLAQARQRLALRIATGAAKRGFVPVLFLGTMEHHRGNSLRDDMTTILEGWRAITSTTRGRRWMERHGIVAAIRGAEVTEGNSAGWHPHIHGVFYCSRNVDLDAVSREARALWEEVTGTISLEAWGFEHPRNASHAAEYAAKGGSSGVGYARETQSGQRWSSVWRWLDTASVADMYRWVEYGEAMAGRRAMGMVNRKLLMEWAGPEEDLEPPPEVDEEAESDPIILSSSWLQWAWNTRVIRLLVGSRMARRTLAHCIHTDTPPTYGSGDSVELVVMAVQAYYNTG